MTVRSDIFLILCKSDTTLSITDEHLIIKSVDRQRTHFHILLQKMTMKKLTMKLKIGLCLILSQKTSNASKTTFVFPLPIFNVDDHFIKAPKANGCLRNTLVEVHFSLMHYKIGSPGQT